MRLFLLFLLFISTSVKGQIECEVFSSTSVLYDCPNCTDFNKHSNYQYNVNNTPIKNVRIVVHVFNKSDGTGNLPDNSTSRNWINSVVYQMNSVWSNLQPMNIPGPNPSNYYTDSRVRLILDDIYFWNDDGGFDACHDGNGGATGTDAGVLYSQYVTNQSVVLQKGTAIHIFLSGYSIPNRGYTEGLANNYLVASGLPQNYGANNPTQMA